MSHAALEREPLELVAGDFRLTPLSPSDAEQILGLFGDPAVVEYMDIAPLADLAAAKDVIGWAQEQRAKGAGVRWAIRRDGGEELFGTCGYNVLELDRGRRGEIAYDLARRHWGQGVMSGILPVVMAFGFGELGLRRIEAMVTEGNEPSCRLLERHGFRREGLLRDHAFWKGRFWNQLIYARLSEPGSGAPY